MNECKCIGSTGIQNLGIIKGMPSLRRRPSRRRHRRRTRRPTARGRRRTRMRGGTVPPSALPRSIEPTGRAHDSDALNPIRDRAERRRATKSLRNQIRREKNAVRKAELTRRLKEKTAKTQKRWDDWNVFAAKKDSATRTLRFPPADAAPQG